jgi:hypothetical protein
MMTAGLQTETHFDEEQLCKRPRFESFVPEVDCEQTPLRPRSESSIPHIDCGLEVSEKIMQKRLESEKSPNADSGKKKWPLRRKYPKESKPELDGVLSEKKSLEYKLADAPFMKNASEKDGLSESAKQAKISRTYFKDLLNVCYELEQSPRESMHFSRSELHVVNVD